MPSSSKLAERLDRTEKAQAEPAAKIAKIAEGLDRVERRDRARRAGDRHRLDPGGEAGRQAAGRRRLAPARLLFRPRRGREPQRPLFEIGPGSNLPGLGRVEAIRRENGQVVVVTRNGIIAAALPRPRRLPVPRYLPYLD